MYMVSNLPPLSAIRAFEAASRHLNFTRAGTELGMTQAAVSYQIKVLEDRLGFPLFLRKARRIELTEMGQQLAGQVIDAFGDLRQAFDEIRGQNDTQLVVSSNTTFAVNWLSSRLVYFQMQNPDLAIRIIPYGPMERPEFINADITVSACYAPPKDWCRHEIIRAEFSPMLSPALAATIDGVRSPEDLLKLPLVDPHDPWWKIWFTAAGLADVDLSGRPFSRMGSQALETNRAIAGQGVAILTPYFCKAALDNGLLVQPFELIAGQESEAWILSYPQTLRPNRKVRLFRDWVFSELREDGVMLSDAPPAPAA